MRINKEHLGIRVLYWLVMTSIILLAVYAVTTLFFPLVLGFLVAFLTDPLIDWMERRGWPRSLAAMALFGTILAVLVALVAFIVPHMQNQISDIIAHQELYHHILEDRVTQVRTTAVRYLSPSLVNDMETGARSYITHKVVGIQHSIPEFLGHLAHALSVAIFVPIIAFFFLVEGAEIKKWIIRLLPNRYFEMTLMMMHQVNTQLGGYIRGQAMDCIINGTLYALGMSLLGVKGGFVLGTFAGLLNVIPYVGPVIGAIPGICSLMIDPAATVPWWSVAVLFLCVHLLDDVLIYPMTVGKSLDLPPFVVILGILFGGSVAGVPGMLLTVPLLGMATQTFAVFRESLKSYKII